MVGSSFIPSIDLKKTALMGGLIGLGGLALKKGYDKLTKKGKQTAETQTDIPQFPQRQPARDIFKGMEEKLKKTKENVSRLTNLRDKLQRKTQGRFGGDRGEGQESGLRPESVGLGGAVAMLARDRTSEREDSPPPDSDLINQYLDGSLPEYIRQTIEENLSEIQQLSLREQNSLLKELMDSYDSFTKTTSEAMYSNPLDEEDKREYSGEEILAMLEDSDEEIYKNPQDPEDENLYTAQDIREMIDDDKGAFKQEYESDVEGSIINTIQREKERREQEEDEARDILAGGTAAGDDARPREREDSDE